VNLSAVVCSGTLRFTRFMVTSKTIAEGAITNYSLIVQAKPLETLVRETGGSYCKDKERE
jgi:hypothetical protein